MNQILFLGVSGFAHRIGVVSRRKLLSFSLLFGVESAYVELFAFLCLFDFIFPSFLCSLWLQLNVKI